MPTERTDLYWRKARWFEGAILLAGAPFLLFPERYILVTAIALLLVAALWLAPLVAIRSPLIPPTPFNLALTLLSLMILTGLLVSADSDLTLPKVSGLVLGLSVWRFMVLALRDRRDLGWAALLYLGAGAGFVLLGFLSADWLLKGTSQVGFLNGLLPAAGGSGLLGLGSTGIHPNQIAGTITLLLPLSLALLVDAPLTAVSQSRLLRAALVVNSIALSIALLLTQSRSGWLGAAGGAALLLLLWSLLWPPSPARRWLRIALATGGLVALLLFALAGPGTLLRYWLDPPLDTAVGSLATLNFRRELWPWALTAVGDFPLTGTGLGTFRGVATRLYPADIPPGFDFAHAHNIFLQVALDTGIPGLIAYLALLLLSTAVAWQVARQDRHLRPLSLGLLAGLAALHLYGLADALALGAKPAVLLWAVLGFLSVLPRLIK